MTRLFGLLMGFVLLIAACGSGSATDAPTTTQGDRTSAVATNDTAASSSSSDTTAASSSSDSSVDSAAAQSPSGVDGPVAPDFSLVLGDGSTFTLSEGAKPVYMVFWAEW